MAETLTQRLHVGGLTPSITVDHLRDRFRSFGAVLDVEELGIDALGQPRPFAFLTLETTPAQLRKCLNIMSGATWRGTQLRIAPARPRWSDKLEAERRPPPNEEKRKSKRLRRAIVREGGKHAQDMRLVTEDNVARRTFWVNENGHLIRPIAMRPSHPLPRPADAKPSLKTLPPKRSHCRVIDPRRWNPTHLAGGDLEGEVEAPGGEGWTFEEAEEDEEVDEQGRAIIGWWKKGEEVLQVVGRRPTVPGDAEWAGIAWSDAGEDSDRSELFPAAARSASPLFPVHAQTATRDASSSPLFPARDIGREPSPLFPNRAAEPNKAESHSDASSPLFPTRKLGVDDGFDNISVFEAEQDEQESDESASPAATPSPPRSPSPVVEAIESVVDTVDAMSTPAPSTRSAAVPETLLAQVASERSGALNVLTSLLGDSTPTQRAGREFVAFEEESDDDDYSALKPQAQETEEDQEVAPRRSVRAPSPSTPWVYATLGKEPSPIEVAASPVSTKPLRLRGGGSGGEPVASGSNSGSSSSSGSESDSDSSDSSDSDSDSDSSDSSDSSGSEEEDDEPKPAPSGGLKNLFASSAPKFSLIDTIAPDLEIDETVVLPTMKTSDQPELAPLALAPKSTFVADPEIPLFFPLPLRPNRKGEAQSVLAENEEEQEWGAGSTEYQGFDQPVEKFRPKRKAFAREVTDADMQKRWEVRRLELTRGWKRRHREAVKHGRRRGGQEIE